MNELASSLVVGRVLRASTQGFTVGCRVMELDTPTFGTFVKVALDSGIEVIGMIYDVVLEDDPFVRQLLMADELPQEYILDQRTRQMPIEVSVLAVGYRRDGRIFQSLPPQPPLTLHQILICRDEEIRAFTKSFQFFRLVTEARDIPGDELLAAALLEGARVRGGGPPGQAFLVRAGRELVGLLGHDLTRLQDILNRLRDGAAATPDSARAR